MEALGGSAGRLSRFLAASEALTTLTTLSCLVLSDLGNEIPLGHQWR